MADVLEAAVGVGFMVVENTALSEARVREAIEAYRAFFKLPETDKASVHMVQTASNKYFGGGRI